MKRKAGWGLLCILAAVLMMCGCGQNRQKEKEEKVVLSFMMPQSHYKGFFKEEIARFEKEYPAYSIEVLRIPDNQWIDVVRAKTATSELTDLIRIDKSLMEAIGTEKFLEFGQEESWYKRVREDQLENKKIGGKLYGLPVGSSSSVGLIYNKGIFEEQKLSPPRTMEEMRQVCSALKKAGYIPLYASDKDAWTATIGFSTSVSQIMTDEIYEKIVEGEMGWDNEVYGSILEDFAYFREEGYTNSNYMEATYDSAVKAMATGKAAMYMSGQFFINDVQEVDEDIRLGMLPSPYCGDILTVKSGEGMFAVSKKSPYIQEAKIFLEWFSSAENMNEFNRGWNHMPVFQDQEMEMPDWQKYLYDTYILPGNTALEINERFSGIDMSNLWNYQQKMFMGTMSAPEVLENWQLSFEQQMESRAD